MTNKLYTYPVDILDSASGVQLIRGASRFIVTGERASIIVKIIIGLSAKGISYDDLIAEFSPVDHPIVSSLVNSLIERRLAYYAERPVAIYGQESPQDIFVWHFNKTPSQYQFELSQAELLLVGVNLLSLNIYDCLIKSGFSTIYFLDDPLLRNVRLFDELGNLNNILDIGEILIQEENILEYINPSKGILMPCSDFGSRQAFLAWNRRAHELKVRMLPVSLQDLRCFIGPYIVPYSSPCYECLYSRENANLIEATRDIDLLFDKNSHKIQLTTSAYIDAMLSAIAGMATIEVIKIFTSIISDQTTDLIDVSLLEPSLKRHPVLKIPRCQCCSPAEWRPDISIVRDKLRVE